jgi:glycosyltransferase involved in cell wall biosynthesis
MSDIAKLQVVLWGTYDLGKPRTRILVEGLRGSGLALIECHANVWSGIDDKSAISNWRDRFRVAARWLAAYPSLVRRYLRLPRHDVVVVGYLGHLDVLVLWPFAKLRGVPILWDAFLSLHETVVEDRQAVAPAHPLALLLYAWDWLAARAADLVLFDTAAHAEWFRRRFGLAPGRTAAVFVGAEPEAFAAVPPPPHRQGEPTQVLFYGQFIPLHGIETIIEAAQRSRPDAYRWTIIGDGQEAPRIRRRLAEHPVANLAWLPSVPYGELRRHIAAADICLGIFGESGKAERVIPNKAFQALLAGRPLVTRDSPAMRELVGEGIAGVALVPPGDPGALVAALDRLSANGGELDLRPLRALRDRICPDAIGRALASLLAAVADSRARAVAR